MKLENQRLCVEISEMGAEVTRIYDKKKGAELLWEADPLYWKRHSPVLFPNVGKTYRNTVLINGTHYPTSQHGFARDSVFKCICKFPLGFIPYFFGDYGNTFIGFFQQFHCLLYPVFFHIGGNGQTVDFLEGLL